MPRCTHEGSPQVHARIAGVLYLIIIAFGITAEGVIRGGLIVPGDAATTAHNILGSPSLYRAGFAADVLVFLSDVALAVLLYVLLRPVHRTLALTAAAFRLTQTAVIALNLLHHHAALLLLDGAVYREAFGEEQVQALALLFTDLHGHGYDLGLLFFGVSCLVTGHLILRSGYFPKALGGLVMAAGPVYLIGSFTRFLAPDLTDSVAPIYVVALVAELALCLWLLLKGVDAEAWESRVQTSA